VAHALSHFTSIRYGRIASVSAAHDATQFRDSICPVCISTFKCLFIRTQPTRALNDSGRGYHLGASNIRSDHSPSFLSSILHFPLIAPPGLQLCQSFDHLAKPHRTSIDRKGPIASGFQPLVFYRQPTQLSIAYYRYISFIGVTKWFSKGVLSATRISSNSYT
jgi:hypothetical protein